MATRIHAQTLEVHPDEKAMGLAELYERTPDQRAIHRYQIIYVIRNDAVAEYRTDMGADKDWRIPPLSIPSFQEHSVAELQDMAQFARERATAFRNRLDQMEKESTLISDSIATAENVVKVKKNQSQFGPGGFTQRNGFYTRA